MDHAYAIASSWLCTQLEGLCNVDPARILAFRNLPDATHPLEMPRHVEQANEALRDEGIYRFSSFSANDAVTLGLSLRKRFRVSSRHAKGKGLVISIQSIVGHTLFACTVGDLGNTSGLAEVGMDSWGCLEGMMNVVRRTGHSSYYVEKGMGAMGKKQIGIQSEFRINGGAFPIWLENGQCCPIAVVGCYSGSSHEDHHLVVNAIRDYLNKLQRNGSSNTPASDSVPHIPPQSEVISTC